MVNFDFDCSLFMEKNRETVAKYRKTFLNYDVILPILKSRNFFYILRPLAGNLN